jgi:hypothetical protein
MTTRTTTTKGLAKPHKTEAAKPGIGSSMGNARSINTEQGGKKNTGAGLPSTYYANSKACASTDRGKK